MARVSKGVSFSEIDPYEMTLWEHARKQGKFAKYVKRLIARDMEGGQVSVKRVEVKSVVPDSRPIDDVSSFV